MAIQLRSTDDVKRLFSAFGDLSLGGTDLSLHDVDEASLFVSRPGGIDLADLSEVDTGSLLLSLAVASATGWTAIKAYERNGRSVGWGLVWATLGFLMPLPAVAYAAFADKHIEA